MVSTVHAEDRSAGAGGHRPHSRLSLDPLVPSPRGRSPRHMIERGQQVRTERGVVLDHREMAHALHDGEARAGDRAATFEQSLNCLRRRGLLVSYGSAGGVPPPLEIFRLNRMGSLYLTSAGLADYIHDRVEMLARAHDLFEAIRVGAVHVEVRRRYPLAQVERAHRDLEDRRTIGSSILIP